MVTEQLHIRLYHCIYLAWTYFLVISLLSSSFVKFSYHSSRRVYSGRHKVHFITQLQSHSPCYNANSSGVSLNCKVTFQTVVFLRVRNYTLCRIWMENCVCIHIIRFAYFDAFQKTLFSRFFFVWTYNLQYLTITR